MNDLESTSIKMMAFAKHVEFANSIGVKPSTECIEDAILACEYMIEFSRKLSDQISIMAPAIIEIQSLMRD